MQAANPLHAATPIKIALPMAVMEHAPATADDTAFAALVPPEPAVDDPVSESLPGVPAAMPEGELPLVIGMVAAPAASRHAAFPGPGAGFWVGRASETADQPAAEPELTEPGGPLELDRTAASGEKAGSPGLSEASAPDPQPSQSGVPGLTAALSTAPFWPGEAPAPPLSGPEAEGLVPTLSGEWAGRLPPAAPTEPELTPEQAPDTAGPAPVFGPTASSVLPLLGHPDSPNRSFHPLTDVRLAETRIMPLVAAEGRMLPSPDGNQPVPTEAGRAGPTPSAVEQLWLGTRLAQPRAGSGPDVAAEPREQPDMAPHPPAGSSMPLVLAEPVRDTIRATVSAPQVLHDLPDHLPSEPSGQAEGRAAPPLIVEAVGKSLPPAWMSPLHDLTFPMDGTISLPDPLGAPLPAALAPASVSPGGVGAVLPGVILPRPTEAMAAVVTALGDGSSEIALAPEELGKVRLQVQTDVQNPDRLVVVLTFERTETLDLFRRHAADLAETLRAAGYDEARLDFGQSGTEAGARSGEERSKPLGESAARRQVHLLTDETASPAGYRKTGSLDIRL